jgi:enterochelin esterase-like enzyme
MSFQINRVLRSIDPMPRLSFEVTIPPDPERQHVVIVGTDRGLGHWQPERGLALERGPDGRFRGAVDLPGGLVEFKITRGTWETEESFLDGTPALNYQYLVLHDLDVAIEVDHWRDLPPLDHEQIFGKTIDCELDASQFGHHRRAVVWLPPGYMRSHDSRHPVLYLLDGQDSLAALGSVPNETLAADDWVRHLTRHQLIPELILVAVFHREEFGQRDEELSPQWDGPRMAHFLVNDLKPFIDWTFCRDRTLPDPENTGVLGFGLGGSLALWMAMNHAGTFGRFACLSTCFEDLSADPPGECELIRQLGAAAISPGSLKLYFDHGTLLGDISACHYQQLATDALLKSGLVHGRDFLVNVAHGAEHSLTAWRARLGAPLTFLFEKK